jgi:hypothetical protein
MEALLEKENKKFILEKKFNIRNLAPVGSYVQWKLENENWDDYNELYHATRLTENLQKDSDVWFETHSLLKNDSVVGVLLIVGGKIKKLERKYQIENERQSLLLKYFHIVDKGQGLGSFWLSSVIIPHYRAKGFRQIYVNSSHKNSFRFYSRFGSLIGTYEQVSDNNLYKREGSCYKISL